MLPSPAAAHPPNFAPALLWIATVIGASIAFRTAREKPIIPRKPPDALFHEGGASGCSNANILTKLGGARNCLMVSVAKDALIIQPHFPFNLMFLPEIYGLEHRIQASRIRLGEPKSRLFWKSIDVEFTDEDGKTGSVTLVLKDIDGFTRVLREQGAL